MRKNLKGLNIRLHPIFILGQLTYHTGTGVPEYDIKECSDGDDS
jgi:hypothetical protein